MTWYVEDPEGFVTYSTQVVEDLSSVRLYSETVGHILEQHEEFHYEFPSLMEQLEIAIVEPHVVHMSKHRSGTSIVFCREDAGPAGTRLYVPVKKVQAGAGRIATAYFSDEYDAPVIYRKKP